MDFSDLRVFKAVVEEGGVTAAAKRLHRVQSNVTTRIKRRLPPLLARYHAKYPAVRVELRTGTADAVRDMLLTREVDAIFVADCVPETAVEAVAAFEEDLVLIAPLSLGGIVPRSVLEVVRAGDNVAIVPLPERSRRAVTSLAWRRGETSWALKALQAELEHARAKPAPKKHAARVVALRGTR